MDIVKDDWKSRISSSEEILNGKPVIKGTRLSVIFILNLIHNGASFSEICDEYRELSPNDIKACISFAIQSIESHSLHRLSA